MNIDHTLALIIAIGMIILLVMAIIWVGVLLATALGIRRVVRNIEAASDKVKAAVDNPLGLIGQLAKLGGSAVVGNVVGNMRKWTKRSKK